MPILVTIVYALCAAGCSAPRSTHPYEPQTQAARDTAKSQKLTQEAAAILSKDPTRAESLLREALTADLWHGPAHNNLGVIYLKRGDLYAAASEFEWARKLLPNHPDPKVNLAVTLERAGRTDEALSTYASALDVYPEYIPAVQALVRLQIRSGKTDDRTTGMLREIALRGQTEEWRTWAKAQAFRGDR
jgi:Flp pilus assembly protein TadD